MTASPQDAPSGDSLPSRSDEQPQESVPGPSEAAERPTGAAPTVSDARARFVELARRLSAEEDR